MVVEAWIETTIGEQATLQRGIDITKAEQRDGKVPVISSGGVSSYHDTAAVKGPGVVLGRKGVVGSVYFIEEDYWPHDTSLWVKDFHGNYPRFIYYFFKSVAPLIARMDVGSANPTLNRNHVHPMPIVLPPLAEQKSIAGVLGALDDKIELNRRMNATLEATAQALFQSWFVDFDPVRAKLDGRQPFGLDQWTAALFSDSFQDSTLGPIPHGWRAVHLEAIASVGSGKRPDVRSDVVSSECNISLYGGGGRIGYVTSALYDQPILITGRVGTLGLIFRTAEPSWPSDNTLIIEPQPGLLDFTYFLLKEFDLLTLNRGSTQPLLTQADLKRQALVLPANDVIKAFTDVSEPIFRKISSNERESCTLATLRDSLLPKLLSGELHINE
jgi:type I restriction enzyme S subunit